MYWRSSAVLFFPHRLLEIDEPRAQHRARDALDHPRHADRGVRYRTRSRTRAMVNAPAIGLQIAPSIPRAWPKAKPPHES